VEDVELVVIPTVSKAKISRDLSYPIGAEAISKVLQCAHQFSLLRLQFHFWSDNDLRRGKYEFLRVEYLKNVHPVEQYPISRLYQRPPQYQWEIVVQPVPRSKKHQIRTYILDSALDEIKRWLRERGHLDQYGSDIMAFFYDEKLDKFEVLTTSHVEPVR
jgi:hypothetical protein